MSALNFWASSHGMIRLPLDGLSRTFRLRNSIEKCGGNSSLLQIGQTYCRLDEEDLNACVIISAWRINKVRDKEGRENHISGQIYFFSRKPCRLRHNYEKQGRTRQTRHHGTQDDVIEIRFFWQIIKTIYTIFIICSLPDETSMSRCILHEG
jgi:hypothetical protein